MKKFIFVVLFLQTTILSFAQKSTKAPLTLEDIWTGKYDQKDILPQLLNTKPAIAFIRADKATNFEGILTLDMVTGSIVDTIFTNQTKVEQGNKPITFTFFEDFTFSPDDSKILIRSEKQSIYAVSHKEFVFIWDQVKKTLKPVSTDGKISAAAFSPNNEWISYVRDANLYIRNLNDDNTIAITTDGVAGSIINGVADEVYEDGFGLHQMYKWNKQGTKIAYIKINQAFVRKVPLTNYERSEIAVQQKVYAKAGEAISEASIYIYDLKTASTVKLDLGANPNQYITNFEWAPNGSNLVVEKLDRLQQQHTLLLSNAKNGNISKTMFCDTSLPYKRTILNNINFLPDGNHFISISEKDGFNHLYKTNIQTGKSQQLTNGKWEVKEVKAIDTTNGIIYFIANESSATQQHLYKVNYEKKSSIEKLTKSNGWHQVYISSDNSYFFDKYTTLNEPFTYKIYKTSGKEISNKALIENKKFKANIENINFANASFFKVNNSKNNTLNGWVLNTTDKRSGKKPLLLYVYGGNNKQEVTDEWSNRMAMTFRYFAEQGYVVACIDPSGTPGQGKAFRSLTNETIATQAISDIEVAKQHLIQKYNIDPSKTTIMGWSYGGFLSSMVATKNAGMFNKYIAIAPITNWRNYNAPYTERLLQLPGDNAEIYDYLKPESHIDNYKGGLLLIHGTADDNVHLQHSLKFSKALTESDYYYDIQIFADKNHSLSDGNIDKTRMNLFKKIVKFLKRQDLD
jgi:dipeptidyl-peptidase 4